MPKLKLFGNESRIHKVCDVDISNAAVPLSTKVFDSAEKSEAVLIENKHISWS